MNTNDFFDKFIANYPFYQSDKSFTILMDTFRNVFLNETYETIPDIFKSLYENSEIPSDVYDQILVGCGVSTSLINELSVIEKRIFIKSLADFQKYKATVGLVRNVIKAYGNNFEAYELYVDYNIERSRWECKPYPIYKPDYNDGYTRTIPYELVYEKVPTLLIHENQLSLMRSQNLAAFPLKTNIVFISSNYNQSVTSYIQNLIISVFYKTYYDEIITINFQDQTFDVSLHIFLLLWMYIIFNKVSGMSINMSMSSNIDLNTTTTTIDELDGILEEYDNIGSSTISSMFQDGELPSTSLDDFYYKYFYPLKTETSETSSLGNNDLNTIIKNYNSSLITYIDQQISYDTNSIAILIGDLTKSIEAYKSTTTNVNFIKYFSYFKSFLPTIDYRPSQNTVYKILYYVKPFHTEFLDLGASTKPLSYTHTQNSEPESGTSVINGNEQTVWFWNITHDLGIKNVNVVCVDLDGNEIYPLLIEFIDTMSLIITFSYNATGRAIITGGGDGGFSMIYSNDKFNSVYFENFCRQGLLSTHKDVVEFELFPKQLYLEKAFSDIAPISAKLGSWFRAKYLTDIGLTEEFYQTILDINLHSDDLNIDTDLFFSLFPTLEKAFSDIAPISAKMGSWFIHTNSDEYSGCEDDFILLFTPD